MKRIGLVVVVVACGLTGAAAALAEGRRVVDLSYAYDESTIFWPTEKGFELEVGAAGRTAAGYWYAANRFRTPEHGGTHLDAPIHFGEGKRSVDEIPLDRLIGPGVVIDVREACAVDRDHRVDVRELVDWESAHGRIPDGAIVILRTGFEAFWPDRTRYLGTDERGPAAVAKLSFPGLHPHAARWLVEQRAIRAVGLDTASIDHGPSRAFETHRILASADVPALENLTNLGELPPRGFEVLALPMKIRGGTGAPVRAVAILNGLLDRAGAGCDLRGGLQEDGCPHLSSATSIPPAMR